jgi:hypothetical protein
MKYYHPNIAAVEMDLNHFNDTLMAHFWRVQKSRIKQSTLVDKRRPIDEPPSVQSPKMSRNDDSSPSTSM